LTVQQSDYGEVYPVELLSDDAEDQEGDGNLSIGIT
jgi:hypothetical protein